MGVTSVTNQLHFSINMALCVWLTYYEANNIDPEQHFSWNKVGDVWFTVVVIPWTENDDEFSMGGVCSKKFWKYHSKVKEAAKCIAKYGYGKLGHLNITGKDLTAEEAEDRLMSLVWWGDGFYVSDKKLKLTGGPSKEACGYKSIDISDKFSKTEVYFQ